MATTSSPSVEELSPCCGSAEGERGCKCFEKPLTAQSRETLRHFLLYDSAEKLYEKLFGSGGGGNEARAVTFPDDSTKRRVYRLVFDVVHHQVVTEEVLIESSFFARNYELHKSKTLVVIILHDFLQSKFLLQLPRSTHTATVLPPKVLQVAEALLRHRVKLNATLARMRVKANVQTIAQLIPDDTLKQRYHQSTGQLLYTRINSCRVDNIETDVVSRLESEGIAFVKCKADAVASVKAAYHLRKDLIAFSSDCRMFLDTSDIVTEGMLVVQDLASYCIVDDMEGYLKQSADVILTHCNGGIEAFHIATILGGRGKVFVYGTPLEKSDAFEQRMLTLDLNNIEFISAPFIEAADPSDDTLASVSTVVSQPACSLSAVNSCIDFIMQEGDEYMPKLVRVAIGTDNTEALAATQMECISHALKFDTVRRIIHATRSLHDAENELVVKGAVDQHATDNGVKKQFIVPRTFKDEQAGYNITVIERLLTRQAGNAAREIISTAIGLGIITDSSDVITPHTHIKSKKKKARALSTSSSTKMTFAAEQKVVTKKANFGH